MAIGKSMIIYIWIPPIPHIPLAMSRLHQLGPAEAGQRCVAPREHLRHDVLTVGGSIAFNGGNIRREILIDLLYLDIIYCI